MYQEPSVYQATAPPPREPYYGQQATPSGAYVAPQYSDDSYADIRSEALNNRAVSLWDLGKREQAMACWEEACALDPRQLEALYNSHLVHWRSGATTAEAVA